MQRAVNDCLERLRDAAVSVRSITSARQMAITTTPGYASLWLIPRLTRFTASHPGGCADLGHAGAAGPERGGIDVLVRLSQISHGVGSTLFEETVLPECARQSLNKRTLGEAESAKELVTAPRAACGDEKEAALFNKNRLQRPSLLRWQL